MAWAPSPTCAPQRSAKPVRPRAADIRRLPQGRHWPRGGQGQHSSWPSGYSTVRLTRRPRAWASVTCRLIQARAARAADQGYCGQQRSDPRPGIARSFRMSPSWKPAERTGRGP